jgi:hypothetical protein
MAGKKIDKGELKKLLAKAKADATFRDKLLKSPEDALKNEGLDATKRWVDFFKGLKANNFEKEMDDAIKNSGGEAGN